MTDRRAFIVQALGAIAASVVPGIASAFVDPLDEPAMRSRLGYRSPLLAVSPVGARLVAVGYRGQSVTSDDGGQTWTQATVPVGSDLVAISFASEQKGWAVGHGGVVLHTADGGKTWVKQLDGRQASELAINAYQRRLAEGAAIERLLADEKSLADMGGTQPFLDVHFETELRGYVVGTFNRIFRTDDGGTTWVPWMDRTENPGGLHFNAITGRGGKVFIAGEQGTVWRLDADGGRFVQCATGYTGTLFGLLQLSPTVLLTFGMRGSVYRSEDAGDRWSRVPISNRAGVTAGTQLPGGQVVLVTQAGTIEVSRDMGRTFSPIKANHPMSYYDVAPRADGELILAGAEGMRIEKVR